jgi:uncharacterized protein YndB with AHSA1/START domain
VDARSRENAGTDGREIVTVREFHAPQALMWRAWTEPDHLARWWGPKGFRNTFETFDLRPDGEWRFVMHGPDGTDYKNRSLFREIARPERLVFDHVSGHIFQGIAILEAQDAERTRVTYRMLHRTAEDCERVKALAGPSNEEMFDRLEAELGRMK